MAPKIKLTYFNIRGRAEPIRLAFLVGKVDYDDVRVGGPQWAELKPQTPYGSLPVMEVDGREFAQSGSALRYAGRLTGAYPSDAGKALLVDEVVDTLEDVTQALFAYRGPDKEKVKESREKFVTEAIPRYVEALDRRIKETSPNGPYTLEGDEEPSIADFSVVCTVNALKQGIVDHVPSTCIDHCNTLMRIYNAFMARDDVKQWYQKYPIPNVTA